MKAEREVQRTLVVKNDNVVLPAGNYTTDLLPGQLGLFFGESGTSFTAATATATVGTPFTVAVGLGPGKFRKSAGMIKSTNLRSANVQCYVPAVTKVVDVMNICAECAADYALKIEISSSNVWHQYGMQPFTQTATYTTACCTEGTPDCLILAQALRNSVNNDPRQLFTATLMNPAALDLDDLPINESTYDSEVSGCPVIRLTANAQYLADFCGIPELYSFPSGVDFKVGTVGFNCCTPNATTVTVRDVVYAQGEGADIKYMEWFDAGNAEARPYRLTESGVTTNVMLNAEAGQTYAMLSLAYDDPHEAGSTLHSEPKALVVGIPCTSTRLAAIADAFEKVLGTGLGIKTALLACSCQV